MEEKKFDIKSFIGFTLIFGILMWMMYSNQPTKEELAETAKKEQADKEAKTPKSVPATTTQFVQKTDSTGKVSQEALSKLGAFAYAESLPTAKDSATLLANNVLRLTIANKGGYISEATILNEEQFKKGSGKAVQIIKDNNANFNLTLTTKDGKVINTKDLYFEPKYSKEGIEYDLFFEIYPPIMLLDNKLNPKYYFFDSEEDGDINLAYYEILFFENYL